MNECGSCWTFRTQGLGRRRAEGCEEEVTGLHGTDQLSQHVSCLVGSLAQTVLVFTGSVPDIDDYADMGLALGRGTCNPDGRIRVMIKTAGVPTFVRAYDNEGSTVFQSILDPQPRWKIGDTLTYHLELPSS